MPTIVAKLAGGPDMPPARPPIRLSRGEAPVQLDFSTYPGQVGVEWANILQGRLVMPSLFQHSDIKILRVRRGAYGSEKAADGRLQTGGIQQEMARMDLALAARFPITVHVAHHSENPRSSYERAEGALKGRVVVHPMNLFSGGAAEIREKICRVIDDIGPSLVHVHHPHDPIDWEIISHIPKTVPVVASYHGAAAGSVNPHGNQPLRRALTLIGKTLKHYGAERRSGQSPLSALTATGKQVVEFLSRPKLLQQCRLEVTQRASLCQYSCAALTAVSEAGQMDLGEFASCIVPPPVDPDFFSRARASTDHGRSILRSAGIPDDALIIMYHARLCEQKGQQILPRIAALLKQAVGDSFAFLIVGPEWQPGMMRMIEQEIMQSDVQENVFVLPGVAQTRYGISCRFPISAYSRPMKRGLG
jgi:glycosyltransferase involved in cell wall biosynthesis